MTDVLTGRKCHVKMDTQVEDGLVMMDAETDRYVYKPRNAYCWVRELEKARFRKTQTSTLQEQIPFNEARRGSSQISGLLH